MITTQFEVMKSTTNVRLEQQNKKMTDLERKLEQERQQRLETEQKLKQMEEMLIQLMGKKDREAS